jgi:hypothetical protein
MNLTVEIPDDVAQRLSAVGGDLSRRALEALVAEEYKQGHLTKPDLRRLLSLETSDQIDGFLKASTRFKTWNVNAPAYNASAFDAPGCRGHQPHSLPGANRSD